MLTLAGLLALMVFVNCLRDRCRRQRMGRCWQCRRLEWCQNKV